MKKKEEKVKKKPDEFPYAAFLRGAGMRIANWREGQKAQSGRCGD